MGTKIGRRLDMNPLGIAIRLAHRVSAAGKHAA